MEATIETDWITSPEVITLLCDAKQLQDGDEIIFTHGASQSHDDVAEDSVLTIETEHWFMKNPDLKRLLGAFAPWLVPDHNEVRLGIAGAHWITRTNIKAWRRPKTTG